MAFRRLSTIAAAMLAISAASIAQSARAETLLDKATPDQKKLYEEARPPLLAEAREKPLILAKSDEGYFWKMSGRIIPLLTAYHYSHDPVYLETYVPLQEQILSQRYIDPIKPEWSGWFEYDAKGDKTFEHVALIDHDTILYFVPVLMFVQEVRADPALKAKYGDQAEAWLKDVEASIHAWDKRGCWVDFPDGSGWYHTLSQYPDPKTGELKPLEGITAGGSVPYNKVHALFAALSLAYRITGDKWYTTRMEKCCQFFRKHWREDDKHVEWNYRDHAFPGDYSSGILGKGPALTGAFVHPKGGYYAVDAQGVVDAWDLDIFYKKPDLEKLIKTNLDFMYLGDPKDPQFKNIDGSINKKKYNYIGRLFTALAHFSPKTRELWKTEIDLGQKKNTWLWWADAIDYLTEVSQPVSWDHRYVKSE